MLGFINKASSLNVYIFEQHSVVNLFIYVWAVNVFSVELSPPYLSAISYNAIINFNEVDIRIYLPQKSDNSPRPLGRVEYHF